MFELMKRWSLWVGEKISEEDATRDVILKQGRVLLAGTGAISSMPLVWGSIMLALGFYLQAGIYYAHTLIQLSIFLYGISFRKYAYAAFASVLVLMLQPFIVQWTLGGFRDSGMISIWAIGAPLCAPFVFDKEKSFRWLALFAILLIVSGIFEPLAAELGPAVPVGFTNFLFVGNAIGSVSAFFAFVYLVVLQIDSTQELADSLLLNVLPSSIAERLKRGQETIADDFQEVTVLFADIVDFTSMSAECSPVEMVQLLNGLFSEFDELAAKYDLEKIKTIGDAYMVAGGLPERTEDHTTKVMQMAHDMINALKKHRGPNGEQIQLRIGVNAGPVTAGVIGRQKFIYDLWGDAVNVASRMESNGLKNVIQVTPFVYEKLKDQYAFEEREPIFIKGKGQMTTYLVRV